MAESETGIIASDFLLVDDLLDFSNEELAKPIGLECGTDVNEVDTSTITGSLLSCNNTSLEDNRKNSHFSNAMSTNIEAHNTPGDLCVPCDDLAELEWLSNFMEDSFSTRNGVTETSVVKSGKYLYAPEIFHVPARARSKRSRAPVCNWVSRCILSPTSSASGRMSSFHSVCAAGEVESVSIQVNNKFSKTSHIHSTRKGERQEPSIQVRKCSHCSTQKTPQWRAGPEGPKTLCNACGVRFKSGRLLPEYRPAASPTFVLTKHSNSHRKVIEMRRLKNQTPYHPLPTIVQGLLDSHSSSSSSSAGDDHSCYEETDNECLLHNNKTTEINFCY